MPLLYSQLLTSPHISEEIKHHLRECMVIDATNVSDYYYQGTDQEIWYVKKDFPNIAPPFDLFFFEFNAPTTITSRVHGTYTYTSQPRPKRWGILCKGTELATVMSNFDSESGRELLLEQCEETLQALSHTLGQYRTAIDVIMQGFQPQEAYETLCEWAKRLKNPVMETAARTYFWTKVSHICMKAGNWEEVKALVTRSSLQGARWSLECILFMQFPGSSVQHLIQPCFQWTLQVSPDGLPVKIGATLTGEDSYHTVSAIGESARKLMTISETEPEIIEKVYDNANQFLHTGLLAISFMHCKNVVLKKTLSESAKPLTRGQVKRGCKIAPRVTYHILDIEPMKQVLKTEGQSEKVGIQHSLHICRGHFSHYTEDKKLFGKYAGTFWIPQHIRGSQKVGITLKDYRIKGVKQEVAP